MKIKASSIVSAIEYLLLLFIVLDCNTVYSMDLKDYHFSEIIVCLCIILLLVDGGFKKRSILKRWVCFITPYGILMLLFVFISVPVNSFLSFSTRYLIFLPACVLLLLVYIDKGKMNSFFTKLENIMTILAVTSLFFCFLVRSFISFLPADM